MQMIQSRRIEIWHRYHDGLAHLAADGLITLPDIPAYATNNAHMFYIVCRSLEERTALIKHLKANDILAVFHYLSLHRSTFYTSSPEHRPQNHQQLKKLSHTLPDGTIEDETIVEGMDLPACDRFADCLLRLPMFYELSDEQADFIVDKINEFYAR